jgi:hypothetical protein
MIPLEISQSSVLEFLHCEIYSLRSFNHVSECVYILNLELTAEIEKLEFSFELSEHLF